VRVLVTGAAGFIGSHVCEALLARGDEVVGLDNFDDYYSPARKRANIAALGSHPRFTLHEADIRESDRMDGICAEASPDVVVHLAAMANVRYSVGRARLYVDVNVRGTVNLLEAARNGDVPHFVFASTSSVYGRALSLPFRESDPAVAPLAPYPATKIAGEVMGHAYHNMFGMSFTALRFFNAYGPRSRPDTMPYHVTECIVHGREFALYEAGEMYRDWTYVADIVAGVLAAVDRRFGYEVINLGRGEPVRLADFVSLVEQLAGKPARVTTPPAPQSDLPINYADVSKARRLLGYDPQTPLAEGLRYLWEWYQAEVLDSGPGN
jgi:UDP-glucuronate 4-epimerase